MFNTLGPFFLIMSIGYLWRFLPGMPESGLVRGVLGAVVVNLFIPALAFIVMAQSQFDRHVWQVPSVAIATCFGTVFLTFLFYKFLSKFKKIKNETFGALLLATGWGNITFLGYPVISTLFGHDYEKIPFLYDLLAMSPLIYSLGVSIAIRYGRAEPRATNNSPWRMILAVIKLPPLWAGFLGALVSLSHLSIPKIMADTCLLMGKSVPPLMIFSVGLALNIPRSWSILKAIPALALKMLVGPALAFAIATALGMDHTLRSATTLEAGMPTMVVSLLLSDRYGLDSELLAQIIALGTLLSFLTLPLIYSLTS